MGSNDENQTTEEQVPDKPPEENVTIEETTEIQYTYDPNQTMGIYFIDVAGEELHGNSVLIKRGDLDILIDAKVTGLREPEDTLERHSIKGRTRSEVVLEDTSLGASMVKLGPLGSWISSVLHPLLYLHCK